MNAPARPDWLPAYARPLAIGELAGGLPDLARALLWRARRGPGVRLATAHLLAAYELADRALVVETAPWTIRAVGRGIVVPLFPILCPRCSGQGFVGWARAACPECACWKCSGPRPVRGGSTACVLCREPGNGAER